MSRLSFIILCLFLLTGCGNGPLSLLTGGGPNVAANVQAGKTNTQTVGKTDIKEVSQSVRQADTVQQSADQNQVRTEQIETLVIEQQVNGWWIVLFTLYSLALFWLPSPGQIGTWLKEKVLRRV